MHNPFQQLLVAFYMFLYFPSFVSMWRVRAWSISAWRRPARASLWPTHASNTRILLSTHDSDNKDPTNRRLRRDLLHAQLQNLGLDPMELGEAALQSIQDPIRGYDGRYGKSAIKAYRSFVQPKVKTKVGDKQQQQDDDPTEDYSVARLTALAVRAAQQIDFLKKRHEAHQTEWIRHHDVMDNTTTTSSSSISNEAQLQRFPLILVLDNVRSAQNVGSLFRTADATGCAGVWTVGITPHPGGNGAEKLAKTALGAEGCVPTRHFATLTEALDTVRQQRRPRLLQEEEREDDGDDDEGVSTTDSHRGYQVVGMETTERSVNYTHIRYDKTRGVALLLGNEVTGVTPSVLFNDKQVDTIVEIPTFGVKNSLNVAACAPIVMYEILRQWNGEKEKS